MIQKECVLKVTDNSGAKTALCIQVLGGTKKRYAHVGDKIVVTVKTVNSSSSLKKGTIAKAVVVRTKKEFKRKDGSYIRFEDNAIVLIEPNNEPKGTGVFGPVAREVRDRKYLRIASLAAEVL